MRTFIIKARKGSTRWERIRTSVGSAEHFEVVAHTVMNAFFIASNFRSAVEVYIVLDSSEDFPRTIKLSSFEGLSLSGFHEAAVLGVVEKALKDSQGLLKDETRTIAPGLDISGFGFEKLITRLSATRSIYLLDPKGTDIRNTSLEKDPVFVLTDHLVMPPKTVSGLKRRGVHLISLGKKMLFASQCVVLIHDALDRLE